MKLERRALKAVYDSEIIPLLEKLKLKEAFEQKKIKCIFCGDIITLENFGGLYREKTKKFNIKIFCNKPACYLKALKENCE